MKYLLSLILIVTGFAVAQTTKSMGTKMPKEIVSRLIEAMQKNDAEVIRSLFSINASQAYGASPPKIGEAFRSWLESDIISVNGQVHNPSFSVNGTEVIVKGTYKNNSGYTSPANFLFKVDNGQIIAWTMRY